MNWISLILNSWVNGHLYAPYSGKTLKDLKTKRTRLFFYLLKPPWQNFLCLFLELHLDRMQIFSIFSLNFERKFQKFHTLFYNSVDKVDPLCRTREGCGETGILMQISKALEDCFTVSAKAENKDSQWTRHVTGMQATDMCAHTPRTCLDYSSCIALFIITPD